MLADALPPEYPPTRTLDPPLRPRLRRRLRPGNRRRRPTSVAEPADQFYGDRLARITDPHNNQCSISTHIEDLTPDQIAQSLAALGGRAQLN